MKEKAKSALGNSTFNGVHKIVDGASSYQDQVLHASQSAFVDGDDAQKDGSEPVCVIAEKSAFLPSLPSTGFVYAFRHAEASTHAHTNRLQRTPKFVHICKNTNTNTHAVVWKYMHVISRTSCSQSSSAHTRIHMYIIYVYAYTYILTHACGHCRGA
jgi:hypothetical protein